MLVGSFEISINVIVNKHVQSIRIIRAFCLPGGTCQDIQWLGGQKKLLGCGLLVGISTQADAIIIENYLGEHGQNGCVHSTQDTKIAVSQGINGINRFLWGNKNPGKPEVTLIIFG